MTDSFDKFKKKKKFVEDNTMLYPGIADESLRPILTEKIDLAADDFEKVATSDNSTEKQYQEKIKVGLLRFSDIYLDTEDRERVCVYFEELMSIVGLESSNGQLSKFMYGFDPTDFEEDD